KRASWSPLSIASRVMPALELSNRLRGARPALLNRCFIHVERSPEGTANSFICVGGLARSSVKSWLQPMRSVSATTKCKSLIMIQQLEDRFSRRCGGTVNSQGSTSRQNDNYRGLNHAVAEGLPC